MISRRWFLAIVPSSLRAAARGTVLAPARFPYDDLATDLPVVRLTDPTFQSLLPVASHAPVARKGGHLLFASDASGRFEVYRLDLRKQEARQLTEAEALIPFSLLQLPNDNGFLYADGDRLFSSNARATQLYRSTEGFHLTGALHASSDGLYVTVVEQRGGMHRLRLVNTRTLAVATLADAPEEILDPVIRPRRAAVLHRRSGALHLSNFDGKQSYRLRVPEGPIAQAAWSPDGRTVLYLQSGWLREFAPDSNEDRVIVETSQFAAFGQNADATVFAGSSGGKVSPYVSLLVRAVKRELTLCEHRASDPQMVHPQFSPNSRQIYFNSDLHGKAAIYGMDVQKLVEATE